MTHPLLTALNRSTLAGVCATWLLLAGTAQAQHSKQQVQEDIQKHEQMAAAHAAAAQCLREGRSPDACTQALQNACKGVALGKHCGMRHGH